MRKLLIITLFFLLAPAAVTQAQSTPDFPQLTGRVVDQAEMLDPGAQARLTEMLKAHEQATGEQVVVATLPNLQGYPIEDYGYQLGRHWGIGQKGEDNGALLLVAEEERKVRIEVGYGLEGRLTDAAASTIIHQIVTPAFRQGDFTAGIMQGAAAMVQVLGGEPLAQPTRTTRGAAGERPSMPLASLFFLIMMAVVYFLGGGGKRGRRRGRGGSAFLGGALLGAGMGRGGLGGGFGGGGFGGGGGGFGGGGASGGW